MDGHEGRRRLAERWLRRENDRPLLGFSVGSLYPLRRYPGGARRLRDGRIVPADVVVADYLDDSDRLFAAHEQAGGDLVWSAAPFWGIPWLEASLGCGVVADLSAGSLRSVPPVGFRDARDIPPFSPTNAWVRKLLEFIPALEQRSAGRYPVGLTLMRGISDLLSALYGGEGFIFAMLERPAEVHDAVARLADHWIAFGRCLRDRLPECHGGTGSYLYGWMPGRNIWMQEDASALLSPALYEEFILPADVRIAGAFETPIVHLHPARFVPVERLLDTRVGAIELHVDLGGPTVRDLLPLHRRILERKPLLVFGALSAADVRLLIDSLPVRGLAIEAVVANPEDARRMADALDPH